MNVKIWLAITFKRLIITGLRCFDNTLYSEKSRGKSALEALMAAQAQWKKLEDQKRIQECIESSRDFVENALVHGRGKFTFT